MSSLKITDLNFWEIDLPDKGEVKGGVASAVQVVQTESEMTTDGSVVSSISSYQNVVNSSVSSASSYLRVSTSIGGSAPTPSLPKLALLALGDKTILTSFDNAC